MDIAIVGCGETARLHAEIAQAEGHRIVLCCGLDTGDESETQSLAKALGAKATSSVHLFTGYDVLDFDTVLCTETAIAYTLTAEDAVAHAKTVLIDVGENLQRLHNEDSGDWIQAEDLHVFAPELYDPALCLLGRQVVDGAAGDVGMIRLRHHISLPPEHWERTGFRPRFTDLVSGWAIWLAKYAGPASQVFSQIVSRDDRAQTVLTTYTMQSGAIAEVVSTITNGNGHRIECEVAGTGGILQYDSADETLNVTNFHEPGEDPSFSYLRWEHEARQAFWAALSDRDESGDKSRRLDPDPALCASAMIEATWDSFATEKPKPVKGLSR